jgi:hypothetical protein
MDNPYASPSSNLQGRDSYGGSAGVSQRVAEIMRATKPWVQIVSITGWVQIGITIVQLIMLGDPKAAGQSVIQLAIMASLAAKLWQYGSCIGRMLESGRAMDLQAALAEHRKYWKTIGILAILFLVLVFIGFGIGFASAAGRSR